MRALAHFLHRGGDGGCLNLFLREPLRLRCRYAQIVLITLSVVDHILLVDVREQMTALTTNADDCHRQSRGDRRYLPGQFDAVDFHGHLSHFVENEILALLLAQLVDILRSGYLQERPEAREQTGLLLLDHQEFQCGCCTKDHQHERGFFTLLRLALLPRILFDEWTTGVDIGWFQAKRTVRGALFDVDSRLLVRLT